MDSSLLAGGVVALGYQAGKEFEIGDGAVLIGRYAGAANGSAKQQTVFIGDGAGRYISSAFNTAVGAGALRGGTTSGSSASYNTAVGSLSLTLITTGDNNVAVGADAGAAMTTGGQNTLSGYESGASLTTGGSNTFYGYKSGQAVTGYDNIRIGSESGAFGGTAGGDNIIIGRQAGIGGSSGTSNIMIGRQAGGTSALTGSNIVMIGESSAPSATSVSNEITLGNSSITSLRCAVTSITSLSDERDKSEIKDLEYGLAFIDALQPREFVWDNRPEITKTPIRTDEDGNVTYEETEFYSANKGKKDFGFIAQEVRELDNDTLRLVYTENEDKLELSYGKLVPILVKAIQELSAKNTALEARVKALEDA